MFVFIILHYITTDDTIRCIRSIQKHASNSPIIIVDNASPNNSGKELRQKYIKNPNIIVILNKKNLGFAAGNNIGFTYAKEHFNPNFIILCNSDTEIISNNLTRQIEQKYIETNFAVLGPREQLPNGQYYPPMMRLPSIVEVQSFIKKLQFRIKHPRFSNIIEYPQKVFHKFINIDNSSFNPNQEYRNVVLHGAFLVFSKEYIEKFNGLDDRTFLYGEEQLLAIRLKRNKLLSVYDPKITILHNHHSSTKAATENKLQRQRKRAEYELQSAKILLEEIQSLDKSES